MPKRERRTFTEEFKEQIVMLYKNGKPRKEIIREYDLTPSSLDKGKISDMNKLLKITKLEDYVHFRYKFCGYGKVLYY